MSREPVCDHVSHLLAAQNRDGGWAYVRGTSWTEPTAYAILALMAWGLEPPAASRGLDWLRRSQRSDGGWSPQPGVTRSTWVTALSLLVCADRPQGGDSSAAARWLVSSAARNSRFFERLRTRLLDREPESGAGWSYFPETAGWVVPTAMSVLALSRLNRLRPDSGVAARIGSGREFLRARRCADGGWNHGTSSSLGYEAGSYPETTGLALLALAGSRVPGLAPSIEAAERHLTASRSAEGICWLQLALRAHGRSPVASSTAPVCRTITDHALLALAQAAAGGRNGVFPL